MDRYLIDNRNSPAAELARIIGRLDSNFGLRLLAVRADLSSSPTNLKRIEDAILERISHLHHQSPKTLQHALGRFQTYATKCVNPDRDVLLGQLYKYLNRHETKEQQRKQQQQQQHQPQHQPQQQQHQQHHQQHHQRHQEQQQQQHHHHHQYQQQKQHQHQQQQQQQKLRHQQHQQQQQQQQQQQHRQLAQTRVDFPVQKPRASDQSHGAKSIDNLPTSSRLPSSKLLSTQTRTTQPLQRAARPAPPSAGGRKQGAGTRERAEQPKPSSTSKGVAESSKVHQGKLLPHGESDSEDWASSCEVSHADFDSVLHNASMKLGLQESRTSISKTFLESPRQSSRTTALTSFISTQFGSSRYVKPFPIEKLDNVWPKPLPSGLRKAPLPVIWEVTRAALHCRVNLDQIDLKYEPTAKWHDQASLRATLAAHPLFAGQRLPAPSDSIAWDMALHEFRDKAKAVSLCVDLSYNESAEGPLYNVRLQPLRIEVTHRLARRFGADRFLDLILPSPSHSKDLPPCAQGFEPEHLVLWLSREGHEFLGRTWEPFYVRDIKPKKTGTETVFRKRVSLFACEGHFFESRRPFAVTPTAREALTPMTRTAMEMRSMLGWALNLNCAKNTQQPIMKLFSRISLSLSKCIPTVVLERSQILIRDKDLGSHSVMNDGCGRMSRKLALAISSHLGLIDCPSGFQARLGSAKGMWIVDVNDERPEEEWIEIYPSQNKWVCDFQDPHHRTFEVRDWPKELKSASLSQQLIPVLEARSRKPLELRATMRKHAESTLKADLDALISAVENPQAARLWLQSLSPSERSVDGSVGFLGGLPDSNVDKVAFLLDCGFDPRKMKYANDLLFDMLTKKTDTLQSKMNVTIPCSTYALMVVDFSDTLEENEVALCFSTKFQAEGFSDTLLEEMDILVARAPAHFPSDIQKVRAVSRPKLRQLKDAIVFSTKGRVSLADKLSGGDYDGDRAWVCWDQDIVRDFCNAPPPQKPDLFKAGYLAKDERRFSNLLEESKGIKSIESPVNRACRAFIRESMSFNLRANFLGRCTKYKEKLCYMEDSVASPAAINLSELLSNLVDQSKQGILFTEDDWRRFRLDYLKTPLDLDDTAYNQRKAAKPHRRSGALHILDDLSAHLFNLIDETREDCSKAIKNQELIPYDQELTELRRVYENRPNSEKSGFPDVEKDLKKRLDEVYKIWASGNSTLGRDDESEGFASRVKQLHQAWMSIKPPPELMATAFGREIMEDWGKDENLSPWQLFKASVTFSKFQNHHKFVWYMAGRQLGFIKSRMQACAAETAPVLVIPSMWGTLKPDKRLIMKLAAQEKAALASEENSASTLEEVFDFDDNGTVIDDVL